MHVLFACYFYMNTLWGEKNTIKMQTILFLDIFLIKTEHAHLKAVLPCRDIHGCQVNHVVELRVCVILQEGENRYNPFWVDHYLQLIKAGHLEFK